MAHGKSLFIINLFAELHIFLYFIFVSSSWFLFGNLWYFPRYGSWAVCFTYGTWFGVKGLVAVGKTLKNSPHVAKACEFLLSKQQPSGGWGESYLSCQDKVNNYFVCSLNSYLLLYLMNRFFFTFMNRSIQTLMATDLTSWIQHGLCSHSLVLGKWVNSLRNFVLQFIVLQGGGIAHSCPLSLSIYNFISLFVFLLGWGRPETTTPGCKILD